MPVPRQELVQVDVVQHRRPSCALLLLLLLARPRLAGQYLRGSASSGCKGRAAVTAFVAAMLSVACAADTIDSVAVTSRRTRPQGWQAPRWGAQGILGKSPQQLKRTHI
jgi:hypothetical protein